ncbi:hypothetical protein M433DRAFT_249683 [Acidomyces richmondensis BFW]|nr:MAG: hypothetical protein FE78DRAFT_395720 [Acidomyces sp. 'richmondensis']KYG45563.1 hypothetical protein M433DRAFT_249683 [Acidomyces richmondensis BFW]
MRLGEITAHTPLIGIYLCRRKRENMRETTTSKIFIVGLHIETLDVPSMRIVSWDIVGACKTGHYLFMAAKAYKKAVAIIVVIDATDRDKIVETREELIERVWLEDRRDKDRIRSQISTTFRIEELSAEVGYDILEDNL